MLLVKLIEPPCTERYARWCERSVGEIIVYLLLDCFQRVTKKFFQLFLKNTLPKATPYSEYVKGLIPDSVQELLREP